MNATFFCSTVLRFLPHMKLEAAARIAHQSGYTLHVEWTGTRCKVVPIRMDEPRPALLTLQAGEH